ncbi:hypothetical protein [Elizabethkingia meningoseptica]|uniref:hypothetical protein n=1 Tax=Elizabethkingia meningoseptica TaxID=238 RepID=UPI000841B69E|nr:hypothetical protein [Elizabethkingia meningoseptica]AQX10863.1 hypothetical protein BBD35_00070 [Elizabethkingia meningoseptica]ODM52294.1 hypothetical protein BES09_16085 [Elizabethkingia meningoseptica]OHT26905.1 hypothetical protein BFF93_15290 [Elizabethkingia meningoseptica]OPB71130.1 hypothetical protein BAY31_13370 [Elizabethkingia meningoseptica]
MLLSISLAVTRSLKWKNDSISFILECFLLPDQNRASKSILLFFNRFVGICFDDRIGGSFISVENFLPIKSRLNMNENVSRESCKAAMVALPLYLS